MYKLKLSLPTQQTLIFFSNGKDFWKVIEKKNEDLKYKSLNYGQESSYYIPFGVSYKY